MTDEELANPMTLPNPWIKKLIELQHEMFAEAIKLPCSEDRVLYHEAYLSLMRASDLLFRAKNLLSDDGPMAATRVG